jgi:hypothetical protein
VTRGLRGVYTETGKEKGLHAEACNPLILWSER